MNAVFVDTSFYVAIINGRDQWHVREPDFLDRTPERVASERG